MTNAAFLKLTREFTINYDWNYDFHTFCENSGLMYTNLYGVRECLAKNMRSLRDQFKKANSLWFIDSAEVDIYVELMPFGGYNGDYSQCIKAIKEKRKRK